VPGSTRRLPARSAFADRWAASSGSIASHDRSPVSAILNAWNAAASTGRLGLGVREPARPGSATSASAAVSAAPATRVVGRTIRGLYRPPVPVSSTRGVRAVTFERQPRPHGAPTHHRFGGPIGGLARRPRSGLDSPLRGSVDDDHRVRAGCRFAVDLPGVRAAPCIDLELAALAVLARRRGPREVAIGQ
jgi:hypothetical protein